MELLRGIVRVMKEISSQSCLLSVLLIFSCISSSGAWAEPLYTRPALLGLRHIENKGIGYKTGYTTLEGFLAKDWDRFVPFIDARGHIFNDGKWAANAGIGFRSLTNWLGG